MEKMDQLDIMVDVETLGRNANAIILQLSAVAFNPLTEESLGSFDEFINPLSSAKVGLKCTGEDALGTTLDWWMTQDPKVFKAIVLRAMNEGKDLAEVLTAFSAWIEELKKTYNVKVVKVYGNGPAADCVWMRSSYQAANLTAPWPYWDDMCVRTVIEMGKRYFNFNAKDKKVIPFVGDLHNGIDDCTHQIKMVCAVYRLMNEQKVKAVKVKTKPVKVKKVS